MAGNLYFIFHVMDSPQLWISICKSGILLPNPFLESVKLNGWEVIPN